MTEGTPVALARPARRRPGPGRRGRCGAPCTSTSGHAATGARPLAMEGAARDLRTGPRRRRRRRRRRHGAGRGARHGGLRHLAGASSRSTTTPAAAWTDAVIGTRAGGGFRRHLEEVVPPEEAGSLLRQVLDDMPAAALISGYGLMRMARRKGHHPGTPHARRGARPHDRPVLGVARRGARPCAASRRARACPCRTARPAPPLDGADPRAWHDIGPLEMDWMRRRRCIDVQRRARRHLRHLGHVPRHGGRGGRRRGRPPRVRGAGRRRRRRGRLGRRPSPGCCPSPSARPPPTPWGPWSGSEVRSLAAVGARHPDRHRLVHAPERPPACARRRGGPPLLADGG